jgi:tetratricopeptide (TPR) repeat protein
MPDQPQIRQKAAARRDAYFAGRDLVVVAGAGATEPVVSGLLPRDVPGFTGREEELSALTALAGGGSVVVSAIGGTAGVGKTALAVHAAHQLVNEFPDGHLYADLHGYTEGQDPVEPGEVLEVFLRRLGVPAEEMPVTTEERSGLLRQVLASRQVLMVLDNARSEGQVRPLLPGAGGSLVLVTSRSMLPGLEADARISLDVLPEDEAVAMLAGLAGAARAGAEPGAVRELAGMCGRLPLALRIAGQVLAAHSAWPVAKMTQLLAEERDRLERLGAGDLRVRAAFAVSYGLLEQGDARLFRLLGLHPSPDFDVLAAAALAGIDSEVAGRVLDRLAEAHLVSEDAAGQFGMHDLLRLFARGICRDTDSQQDREAAEARLVNYYAALATFLDSCVDPNLRPAAEREAEQAGVPLPSMREALVMFQAERRSLVAVLGLAAQHGWDEQVWRLSESMGDSLGILHYLDDLLTVIEAALAAARRAGERVAEGVILINLGTTYCDIERFEEAIGCYEQALTIRQETDDRYGEGLATHGLGLAYQGLRRFEEAIGCFQQALAILRETDNRRAQGRAMNDLGNTYGKLRRFEEAVGCFQQDIAICRETGDRYGEGQTLNNLGAAYWELRRFEEAITCYQQSLAIKREIGDRYGECLTLENLGIAYRKMGQPGQAAMCWREAAVAMRDAGDHEKAGRLEQLAADAYARRRRWWRRGSRSAGI